MILFLDTTDRSSYIVALARTTGVVIDRRVLKTNERRGDALFSAIVTLTHRRRLTGVIVVSGPGHFSGVRHGVTVANALAYALQIPVVGVEKSEEGNEKVLLERGLKMLKKSKLGKYVVPIYGKEPTIGSLSLTLHPLA